MRVRLTHLLACGRRPPDALAIAVEGVAARLFVPGWLPCGECGLCRRGLVAACARGRVVDAGASDLPDRFLIPVDEPPGAGALDDSTALCAGVAAEAIEAGARAGLGAGDVAVWLGDDPRCTLGARLASARGARSFHLHTPAAPDSPNVTSLALDGDPAVWRRALEEVAAGAPGGVQERRLFLASADAALVSAALTLAEPGSRLTFLDADGAASVRPSDLPLCRILVGGQRGYHPDFVPEALAALRGGDAPVADLLARGSLTATAVEKER